MEPNTDDVLTKRITIDYGIDGETSHPFWACRFQDLMAQTESIDIVVGMGLLVLAAIDLAQANGMLPMPPGQEDFGRSEAGE